MSRSLLRRSSATALLAAGLASVVLTGTVPAQAAQAPSVPAVSTTAQTPSGTITPFTPTVPNPTTATKAQLDAAAAKATKTAKPGQLFPAPQAQAGADSGTGGQISRGEVIARARTWVDAGVPYSMTSYRSDSNGRYRTDCSGFVSMAWHLASSSANNWGETTGTLLDFTSSIGKESLKPGDILLNPDPGASGHVVIFNGWANAEHTRYDAYEQAGSTGAVHRQIPYPYFSGHGTFSPRRYDNITDAGGGDLTGDGKADLVALESDGSITTADGTGNGFTNYHRIASGFSLHANADRLNYVDADGDGKADLIGLETNGTLTLAKGTGSGFTDYHTISSGYGEYVDNSRLKFGDITGDGKADALAVESDGSLTLAVGTGNGFTNFHKVASGFGEYVTGSRLKLADVTGDGKADLIALENNGSLTLAMSNGDGFSNYHTISSGYGDFVGNDRLRFGDVTGDGKADILAVETDGSLTLGTGTGDGFKDFHKVATGFGTYVNDHRLQLAG
ncbi:FG-GAP-like repeat-containing protein [Streptomyces sp. NPDC002602]|uniref:C40 family peptidase n=1 Tax=Streptomyces sp. NPDC002602 TaxID=3364654 RepID=UPI0036787B84